MPELPAIPGQELEKAAAQVATAAGMSLTRAMGRVANAWAGRISARMEAEARETKKLIAVEGEIKRNSIAASSRRQSEIEELDHILGLRDRALGRLLDDIVREQRSIEFAASEAVALLEEDVSSNDAREINDDWLGRFFSYVSKVDEESILRVFSRALADAALRDQPIISPLALDSLRFFDQNILRDFNMITSELLPFGFLMRDHSFSSQEYYNRKIDDYVGLLEMDLFKLSKLRHISLRFVDIIVTFSLDIRSKYDFEVLEFTQVGESIAGLVNEYGKEIIKFRKLHKNVNNPFSHIDYIDLYIRRFASSIVAFCSDIEEITVTIIGPDENGRPFSKSFERKDDRSPFHLNIPDEIAMTSAIANNTLRVLLRTFEEFDTVTLPEMNARMGDR